ncbi:calcium/calmodulin-dependent protein kinase [Malassezia sp. CBS 17886]|nr:calcium/calmodulin-dependent protein kinase [Malassezia sp. CBS 17886]
MTVKTVLQRQPPSYGKKQEYSFHKTLGKGTFGVVRAATRQTANGPQKVAVKVVSKHLLKGHEEVVMREIETVRGLDQPHIIKLLDWFESKDKFYLVFEEADGGELFDRLSRGRFTEEDAKSTIYVVLEAIAYMHRHHTVHRDIKPENILYRTPADDSNIVLVDFGIAAHLRDTDDDHHLKGLCGSVGYAAPEVIARQGHGKPVDMWGLGVVTFAMLCGYAPFSSADPQLFRKQVAEGKIEFDNKYWQSVSAEAIDFVKRCLTLDPDRRITAEEALHHPWFAMRRDDAGDVSAGLRDNYRSRWKAAVSAVRATQRFGKAIQPREPCTEPPSPLYSDEDDADAQAWGEEGDGAERESEGGVAVKRGGTLVGADGVGTPSVYAGGGAGAGGTGATRSDVPPAGPAHLTPADASAKTRSNAAPMHSTPIASAPTIVAPTRSSTRDGSDAEPGTPERGRHHSPWGIHSLVSKLHSMYQ